MEKTKLFIFLIFLFLVLACCLFFISKTLFTGSVVEEENKTYSSTSVSSPEDKNCFGLEDGRTACWVARVEISEGEIIIP